MNARHAAGDRARADAPPAPSGRRHLKTVIGVGFLVIVVALAAVAVWRDRHAFADALREMGTATVVISGAVAVAAVALTFPVWLTTLAGLGARLPLRTAVAVFFVSQLGKYLPGSVWPVLAQMEVGRANHINRRTMLSANLLTLVLSLTVGSAIACVLLPLSSRAALHRFWWLFIALPLLVPLLHPRVLPAVLDRLFALAGRPPLGERLAPRATVIGAGWAAVSWAVFGGHIAVLLNGLGHHGWTAYFTATGAITLAVCVGILFIPAPAGAGLREVALLLALSALVSRDEGLAVVIVSRVLMIIADLLLAAVGAAIGIGAHVFGSGAGSEFGRTQPASE